MIFIASQSICAQNNSIDSIKSKINQERSSDAKIDLYIDLSKAYYNQSEYKKAYNTAKKALLLAKSKKLIENEIKSYQNLITVAEFNTSKDTVVILYNNCIHLCLASNKQEELADLYYNLGYFHYLNGEYTKATDAYLKAGTIYHQLDHQQYEAETYNNIGLAYYRLGNYTEAIKNQLKALKIYNQTNNPLGTARTNNAIGNIYYQQKNLSNALKYYKISLKYYQSTNDSIEISKSYSNIAIVYTELKNYQKSIDYHKLALQIVEKTDQQLAIAKTYYNLASTYAILEEKEQTKNYAEKALNIYEELNYNSGIAYCKLLLSELALKNKEYKKAHHLAQNSLSISIQTNEKEVIKNAYQKLSIISEKSGDYKNALSYYNNYISYRDSLINEENTRLITQIQMQYEFDMKQAIANEKQKKKDVLIKEKEQRQKVVLISVSFIALLLLIIAFITYKGLKRNQKYSALINNQKKIVEQKNNEIVDSINYAKRIQEAILPAESLLKNQLKHYFLLYQPKDIVAGDFYWLEQKNNTIYLAVADSTGHGVPGAMVSVVCANALNSALHIFNKELPGEILDKAREIVIETFEKQGHEIQDGMDISLLSINQTTKEIKWAGANNPLWYIHNNQFFELKPDKQPVGKTTTSKTFETHLLSYQGKTTFYLITDGYSDQFGGSQSKKFKQKALKQLLYKNHQLSMKQQYEQLQWTFMEWKKNEEQTDDVTLLGLVVNNESSF